MKKILCSFILFLFLITPFTSFALPITDTIGDVMGMYDVTMMDAVFDSDYLYIEVQFANDITSPQDLYGFIDFDTDQNFFTGSISNIDFFGGFSNLGVEYSLDLNTQMLTDMNTFEETMYDLTFGTNSILATVSLSALDNDDGVVNYAGLFADDLFFTNLDFVPDFGYGTSAPIAPIPEPATCLLLLCGIAGMIGVKKQFS